MTTGQPDCDSTNRLRQYKYIMTVQTDYDIVNRLVQYKHITTVQTDLYCRNLFALSYSVCNNNHSLIHLMLNNFSFIFLILHFSKTVIKRINFKIQKKTKVTLI